MTMHHPLPVLYKEIVWEERNQSVTTGVKAMVKALKGLGKETLELKNSSTGGLLEEGTLGPTWRYSGKKQDALPGEP